MMSDGPGDATQKQILYESNLKGIKYGTLSFAVVGSLVLFYSQPHRMGRFMGPSVRSGLPLMAGIFTYSLVTELTMFKKKRSLIPDVD